MSGKSKSKFDPATEAEIMRLYAQGECEPALAQRFGCARRVIASLVRRQGPVRENNREPSTTLSRLQALHDDMDAFLEQHKPGPGYYGGYAKSADEQA